MIQATSISPDLGLRPIPGPDPVELPPPDWWMWLIPLVLIGFLWYWWFRRPIKRELSSQDRLDLAIVQSGDVSIEPRRRYQLLHQALRQYLASFDPSWKTLAADEYLPAWEKLFPDRPDVAMMMNNHWIDSEAIVFGPGNITANQVTEYALHISKLNSELNSDNNEKELNPTEFGRDRNKS